MEVSERERLVQEAHVAQTVCPVSEEVDGEEDEKGADEVLGRVGKLGQELILGVQLPEHVLFSFLRPGDGHTQRHLQA